MRTRPWRVTAPLTLVLVLVAGCTRATPDLPQGILGRWTVIESQGMSVPHSFFWFTMDLLEFRGDGTVWRLMWWPPGSGSDIRLNGTSTYALLGEDQVEFVGSCRYQDPCTGVYTATLDGDILELVDDEGRMLLERAGPPSDAPPPKIVGPSASPTPAFTE